MSAAENSLPSSEDVQESGSKEKPFRRRWLVPVVWLVVCSGLLTYLVIAVQYAREAGRCAHCQNNLTQIGLGLGNFHDTQGSLPPAYLCDEEGKPIHSWHAIMLPNLGHYNWREQYDVKEPWDGPKNGRFQSYRADEFLCPSVDEPGRLFLDYVAVVGPETLWPGRERVKLPPKGEGNPDTILLIEMPDSDYRCFEPRSPTVEEFLEKIKSPTGKGIRTIHPKGLAYVTVGGEVRWFPPETEPETIRKLLMRDSKCEVIPAEVKMEIVEKWDEKYEGK